MTTDAMEGKAYDFLAPRQIADDVELLLSRWHVNLATRVSDSWEQQLDIRLNWKHAALNSTRLSGALETLNRDETKFVYAKFVLEDRPGTICVAVPRPFLLGSLAKLLGEDVEQVPDDRPLTDIEIAIVEIAWQHFARAMTDAQSCSAPLVCDFVEMHRDRDVAKGFTEQEPVVVSSFELRAEFGSQTAYVLLSQETVLQLMNRTSECQTTSSSENVLEDVVKELPMDVVVRLGAAHVHVSELMNLQPGDVLLLGQPVGQPLSLQIGDQTKFLGWPGRVGNRQAFQISSIVLEERR